MQASEFLQLLFAGKPADSFILIWLKNPRGDGGGKSIWLKICGYDPPENSKLDIYFGCGLSPKDYGPGRRCNKDEVAGIPGLWADIDYETPGHKKERLPKTAEEALSILQGLPLKPSIIVKTGGGFHAYWIFKELWLFDSHEERQSAARLLNLWKAKIKAEAAKGGWSVDSTQDLARVLRLPATINQKYGNVVEIAEQNDTRYNPTDFDQYVDGLEVTEAAQGILITEGFTLDPAAEPPFEKFQMLYDMDAKFAASWEWKRGASFTSASEYDLSIASICLRYGWSIQEVVNTIIAHRRKWKNDLKLREDYYRRTISTAKAGIQTDEKKETLTSEEPLTKAQILEKLSGYFGVRIEKVVKIVADPSEFKIFTDQQQRGVSFGTTGDIYSFGTFRAHWADLVGANGPKIDEKDRKGWADIGHHFIMAAEDQEVGEEGTREGTMKTWLSLYLEDRPAVSDREQAVKNSLPIRMDDGKVAIRLDLFHKWIKRKMGDGIKPAEVARVLKILGGERKQIRPTHRSYWVLTDFSDRVI